MSQENLQTMIMQNFGGVKEVYYGIVQVGNSPPMEIYIILSKLSIRNLTKLMHYAKKLSLNIDKIHFVIFHPYLKKKLIILLNLKKMVKQFTSEPESNTYVYFQTIISIGKNKSKK